MTKITIHGLSPSTFTRTVRMGCHEKGIAYEMVDARPDTIDPINPFRKIPAVTHGDLTLYESIAILRYLERVFPGVTGHARIIRISIAFSCWFRGVSFVLFEDSKREQTWTPG